MSVLWKFSSAAAGGLVLSLLAAAPAAAHMSAPAGTATRAMTVQVAAEDAGPTTDASVDWFDPWAVITTGNAVISPAS